jgi:hypothetical protein
MVVDGEGVEVAVGVCVAVGTLVMVHVRVGSGGSTGRVVFVLCGVSTPEAGIGAGGLLQAERPRIRNARRKNLPFIIDLFCQCKIS